MKMQRWYRLKPFRQILIGVSLAVIVLVGGGFLTGNGFLGNMLSELAGDAISILVGLFLVDRIGDYRRELQWHKVRVLTLGAIATHLCNMAAHLHRNFPGLEAPYETIQSGQHNPDRAALAGFIGLVNNLQKMKNAKESQDAENGATRFFEAARWDLNQIQSVLTPRVLQFSGDQELVDLLIEFDDAYRQLHNAISFRLPEDDGAVFAGVYLLIRVSVKLYQGLCESWERVSEV